MRYLLKMTPWAIRIIGISRKFDESEYVFIQYG